MSDELLTEEVLENLSSKARAAHQALPSQNPPGKGEEYLASLRAFQGAASPELVLALVEEVRHLREAERRRQQHNAYAWLERARREGTAVSLGRSGWALPPITLGSAWTPKKQPGPGPEQAALTWTVESGPDANGNYFLRCDKPTRELTADELRRDFVPANPQR
jgi:hypothetical protein